MHPCNRFIVATDLAGPPLAQPSMTIQRIGATLAIAVYGSCMALPGALPRNDTWSGRPCLGTGMQVL